MRKVWKIFWRRKFIEVRNFFGGLILVAMSLFLFYGVGRVCYYLLKFTPVTLLMGGDPSVIDLLFSGLVYSIFLVGIALVISSWIKSNWEEAKAEAKKR